MGKKLFLFFTIVVMALGIIELNSVDTVSAATRNKTPQNYGNVVVFVYFSGSEEISDKEYFKNSINAQNIINMFDGSHGRSMTNYLDTISYGQFKLKNVYPQYDAQSKTIKPYKINIDKNIVTTQSVDATIIQSIINKHPSFTRSFADYNGDGIVDNLTIIMAGTSSSGNRASSLYAHHSIYSGNETIADGLKIGHYNMINTQSLNNQESGVLVHEFLHTLGYADLYKNSTSDYNPVFTWSIMASNSRYLQWPLAYERMHFSNWISIDTLTKSGDYTLDLQSNKEGNQAYIIKSPLNSQEVFVVEYRKRDNSELYGNNTLDYRIGDWVNNNDGGIIVYRVNKAVENLSNIGKDDGIYVFRPTKEQMTYGDGSDRSFCMNAALSKDGLRDTIGCAERNATLEDGALVFSDGTNSGIVIKAKDSAGGEQMSFYLEMPDLTKEDLWRDANFTVSSEGTSDIISICGVPYITYLTGKNGSYKINVRKYINGKWTAVGNSISCGINSANIKLFMVGSQLNVAFNDLNNAPIYKLSGTSWKKISYIQTYGDFDISEVGSKAYISYINDNGKVVLASYNGAKISNIILTLESSWMFGNPKVCLLNNIPYISYRNAVGNIIVIYKYQNGRFIKVSNNSIIGKAYDIKTYRKYLFVTATDESNHMSLYRYNGLSWTKINTTNKNAAAPKMIVSNGILYYVYSSNTADGNTIIYRYDTKIKDFVSEGEYVDGYSNSQSFVSTGREMYVSYTINGQIKVKHKTLQGIDNNQVISVVGHYYIHKKIPAKVGIAGKEYDECIRCGHKKNVKIIATLKPSTTYIKGLAGAKQSFVVTWGKKSYSGYQIRYSLKSSMASSKSVTITNASTISKKISRLKSKKKYYVQIRTYKIVNGKKYYSEWSGKKSVVIV